MWLAEGCVCPLSQFRIVVLSQPMIFATSFCRNPKSNRRLRIASPMVVTSFGYALSLGFFPFRRTRQKSNATSATHCHREHELAKEKLISHGLNRRIRTFLTLMRFINVAPFQLGEEVTPHFEGVTDLNCEAGTIFSASASKRGLPCSETRNGSTRITARLKPSRSR
jgi:hypothetical protein